MTSHNDRKSDKLSPHQLRSAQLLDEILFKASIATPIKALDNLLGGTGGRAALAVRSFVSKIIGFKDVALALTGARAGWGHLVFGRQNLGIVDSALGERSGFGLAFAANELKWLTNVSRVSSDSFVAARRLFGGALLQSVETSRDLNANFEANVQRRVTSRVNDLRDSRPDMAPTSRELITIDRGSRQSVVRDIVGGRDDQEALRFLVSSAVTGFGKFSLLQDRLRSLRAVPFAHGGVVTGATHALIGEAGPEAVVPLVGAGSIPVSLNLEALTRQLFGGGFGGFGTGGGGNPIGEQFDRASLRVEAFGDTIERIAKRGAESLARGIGGALESLIRGTETAGSAFRKLGLSVVNELKNMAVNALKSSLLKSAGGGIGGSILTALLSALAGGGVMTGGGPLALRRYAGGGVARRPQLALFGEGSRPEAFVPLPDGRTIPVAVRGGAGINAIINVAVKAPRPAAAGPGDPSTAKALGMNLGRAVRAEFNELLREARRPGGALNPQGFGRA